MAETPKKIDAPQPREGDFAPGLMPDGTLSVVPPDQLEERIAEMRRERAAEGFPEYADYKEE